jgi:hypothetical protein
VRNRSTAFAGISLVVALLVLAPSAAAGKQGGPAFGADCDPFALETPTTVSASSAARVSEEAAAAGVAEPNVAAAYERALDARPLSTRRAARVTGPIHVPVYIHVIQPNAGTGVVPQSQIDAQMDVLNDAFGGVTGGDNSAVVFDLVNTDITFNPAWDNLEYGTPEEVAMKTALHEGGARSLNLYLVRLATLLGWATFPDEYTGNPLMDGVVVDSRSVPGGTFAPYNEGDTGTHEVGHWIGLFHTFQGGCGPPGDLVEDTEPENGPHFGCPNVNSCPGGRPDPVDNFMSYSDDDCMFRFTAGQTERMHALTAQFRNGAPVGANQSITAPGAPVPVNIQANDPDGDPLSYAVSDPPDHGTLTGSGQALTYTPNGGYGGPDSFAVQATDTFAATGASTVNIDVQSGLDLKAKGNQKLNKLAVTGGCGALACELTASGKIVAKGSAKRASKSFKLKKANATANANGTAKLKLKLAKKKRNQLLNLLKDGYKAKANVTLAAGGSTEKATITIKR